MLKKIKDFFREMLFSYTGTATLVLCVMILISTFNFVSIAFLNSSNLWLMPILALAFLVPFFVFRASRGGKKYTLTHHVALPKAYHLPTIILSVVLMMLGSTMLKLAFISEKYVEMPLYNAFFAHRNGKLFNDLYLILAFCIVPPILEGIIFRGAILTEHDKRGRMTVTVFSSFLFALLGFSLELLPNGFFLGIILCIVAYATESLATSIAVHIAYNFFAVFVEPTFVSIKSVSSNVELFIFIVLIFTLVTAIFLLSHLSRLYRKYSHDKFGKNQTKSTPRKRTAWNLAELMLSIPSILCYIVFIVVTLITNK